MPASLKKGEDGDYKIWGLASTPSFDHQGESILQEGIDLTPIAEGKGFFNFEHSSTPENLLGVVEGYQQGQEHLYVYGSLFKGHPRAEAIYSIMKALEEKGKSAVGLSIEGDIIERDPKNTKIIKKCKINNVSLTFKPANPETYSALMKSMPKVELEFNSLKEKEDLGNEEISEATFSSTQVLELVNKALTISQNYGTTAPQDLSGGSAMSQSSLKEKDLTKLEKPNFKDMPLKDCFKYILKELKVLYPDASESVLMQALKSRVTEKLKPSMI